MKIAIIHLSDIHFRENENIVFERVKGISGVLQSWCYECSDLESCFIVVTGDIASSGKSKQYEQAVTFILALDAAIKVSDILHRIEYIVVPGNHDCNFEVMSGNREAMIRELHAKEVSADDPIIETLTTNQREFFEFLKTLSPGICSTIKDRLYHERDFAIGECKIRFNCYNTAWMSKQHEQQGNVVFPLANVLKTNGECDLVFAIFHHPYNWFELESRKSFSSHIETTADIIFTGHEHDIDSYTKQKINGEISDYMEGGILQLQDSADSSFNGVIIDLQSGLYKRSQFSWNGEIYQTIYSTEWEQLHRSKSLRQRFENNKKFKDFLDDPGVGFTHRYKDCLRLSDIFVYPDLAEIGADVTAEKLPYETIIGEKIIDYVLNTKQLFLIGANLSGKTSLLKTLYSEFVNRGFVPVYINGELLISPNSNRISKFIDKIFSDQYSVDMLEKYKQLSKNERVLLIDDFDESKLNYRGKDQFLDFVQNMFERILITGTDLLKVEEFVPNVHKSLLSFKHCQIAEFGHLLRRRLIKKWLSMGREYIITDSDLDSEVKACENDVDRMILEKVIPSNPFVVLTILQTLEAKTPLDTASGSYGQMYEYLITRAILQSSKRVEDLQKKYDFLSQLAYYLFDRGLVNVQAEQINEVEDIIFNKHDVRIDSARITSELVKVNILSCRDGDYAFKYMYLYYYFVARYMSNYLRDSLEGADIRAKVDIMSKNLFRENYANIMIFLCYLSSDPLIWEAILRNAKEIFREIEPCDLDEHVSFINIMQPQEPKLLVEEKSVEETSEELLRIKDEMESISDYDDTTYNIDIVQDIGKLDPILKLNVAFKSIQILGQILRNFPTKLGKQVKLDMTEECYSVGLRTLKAFLEMIDEDLDEFRKQLGHIIKEEIGIEDEKEISEMVRKLTFIIPVLFSFTIIKTISQSIGSEELTETYKRVTDRWYTPAIRLINISIKLDHFKDIPINEIMSLHRALKKNYCSLTLLCLLILENMLLYHWHPRKRQSILAKLGIEVRDPRLIESPSKKLQRE